MGALAKRNLLVAAAVTVAAALCLGVFCALDSHMLLAQETPQGISSSTVSGIIMVLCSLITAWGGSIYFRCSDKVIRRCLLELVGLLVFWLLVSLLKYCSVSAAAITLYWYLFYAPMIFSPLLFFSCVLHATIKGNLKLERTIQAVVSVVSTLMFLMVLTNNFHFFVFDFTYEGFTNQGEYTYGPGYFIVLGWVLVLAAASFVLFGINARHNLIPALLLIAGVFALLVVYGALYISRFEPLFASNITLDYTLIIFVIAELCLRLKILPTYSSFRDIFQSLPLDTKIVDKRGTIVLSTSTAEPLSPAVLQRCLEVKQGQQTFSFSDKPTKRFRVFPLNGGTVVLTEDATPLVKTQQSLERLQKKLQMQNKLLQQDGAMKSQLFRQKRKRQLYTEIRATLSATVEDIGTRIENLPGQGTPEEAEMRRRELLKIKMLVAYCKRKGSLILNKSDANPDFNRERILLVTNETASDLRAANIECASLVETNYDLPAETVSILYDCFYDFCMASFDYENPVIMLYLHDKADSDNIVEMKIALESDSEEEPANQSAREKLLETLAQHNVAYSLVSDEGSLNLTVLAQKSATEPTPANWEGGLR